MGDGKHDPVLSAQAVVATGDAICAAKAVVNAVYGYYFQVDSYTHHNENHAEGLRAILRRNPLIYITLYIVHNRAILPDL
jgi:hypothetical protein